jgi:hypothetical protein
VVPLTVNAGTDQSTACTGGGNITLTATPANGVPSYTYSWAPTGDLTQSISVLPANTTIYTVTVTDGIGCSANQTYTITQPTLLTASASVTSNYNGKDISCNGAADGTALVTFSGGTAPYSISWSNSATTAAISNLGPGTYTATITDANGCIKTASVTLTQPTVVVLSDTHVDINCFGQSTGSIDLSVSGGTPGYFYSWTNTATTEDIASLASGTYTVTVNDLNNCTKTRTVIRDFNIKNLIL